MRLYHFGFEQSVHLGAMRVGIIGMNSIGTTESERAIVSVVRSIEDFLADHAVPPELVDPSEDADLDGASNVLEYLSNTDPNDPGSKPEMI